MPLTAQSLDDAERHINTALQRLDRPAARAAHECRTEGPPSSGYRSRAVSVTMAGPRFLSIVIVDDAFCGGAHPETATLSLVYDLRTGRPVDWTAST